MLRPLESPPEPEVDPPFYWLLWLAVGCVIGTVALVFSRRRSRLRTALPTAEALALEALDKLQHRLLTAHETDTRWLYADASQVLRRYLAERFNLSALQQTTSELAHAVASLDALRDRKPQIVAILECCDQARFAREGFPPSESQAFLDTVRGLVVQSNS